MRERIVVGVDGSEGSRAALAWAAEEAMAWGASLDAVIVCRNADGGPAAQRSSSSTSTTPTFGPLERAGAEEARQRLLDALAEADATFPSVRIDPQVLRGDPAETLCRSAGLADLLVVGARGRGSFAALLLGSVAGKCAHHSPVPVVIVPTSFAGGPRPSPTSSDRIVVGVDLSEGSGQALRWAIEEATARGWAMKVVTVWGRTYSYGADFYWPIDEIGRRARRALDQLIEEVAGTTPSIPIEAVVAEGDPSQQLLELADGAALLVVGSRGHSVAASWLLGSVASKCARHSPCPVAIVRPRRGPAPAPRVAGLEP